VDVRDLRISPLSQEAPVRPPGLFGPCLATLSLYDVLVFPYHFRTLLGAYPLPSIRVFGSLDAACAGHTKVCIRQRMQ
jgi:hypothetical protein